MQRRVNHDIATLLPALHGLDSLISETTLTSNGVIEELAQVLKSLAIGVQRIVDDTETQPGQGPAMSVDPETTFEGLVAPVPQARKRGRSRRLLPPSPERRQKRKDSHAPL